MSEIHPAAVSAREASIHRVFVIGIVLKGLNALLEIVLGVGLLLPIADRVSAFVLQLAENKMIEDPTDFFATHYQQIAHLVSPESQFFGSMYLLSHGIVKAVLVWGLLRDKLWSYPASLAVLALFVLYQVIKIAENHSIALVLLTIFDLVIMWLVWHEYRQHSVTVELKKA